MPNKINLRTRHCLKKYRIFIYLFYSFSLVGKSYHISPSSWGVGSTVKIIVLKTKTKDIGKNNFYKDFSVRNL